MLLDQARKLFDQAKAVIVYMGGGEDKAGSIGVIAGAPVAGRCAKIGGSGADKKDKAPAWPNAAGSASSTSRTDRRLGRLDDPLTRCANH